MANPSMNSYGLGGPLVSVFPAPIVSKVNPTTQDFAEVGQVWINTLTFASYVLTGFDSGEAQWVTNPAGGGAGVFTDLTATGVITLDSAAAGNVFLLQTTGAVSDIDIDSQLSSVNIVAGEAVADAIRINATNGGIIMSSTLDMQINSAAVFELISAGDLSINSTDGIVTVFSNDDVADCVVIKADAGPSENVLIQSTQGITPASISILSIAGGIELDSVIASKFEVTGAGQDLTLFGNGGSVIIKSNEDTADAITLQTGGGMDETIFINNQQGTDQASIFLAADVGGVTLITAAAGKDVNLTSTLGSVVATGGLDGAGAISLITDGGAAETILINSTEGTTPTSINITSTLGGVTLLASAAAKNVTLTSTLGSVIATGGLNGAGAASLIANGGANETAVVHSTQGTTATSVNISSALGGVTLSTAAAAKNVTLTSTLGSVIATGSLNGAGAASLIANGGANETVLVESVQGTLATSVNVSSTLGGITLTANAAAKDITLNSVLGSVSVSAAEAAADAIVLNASNAASGIQVTTGTNGLNITSGALGMASGILLTQSAQTAAVQVGMGAPGHAAPQGTLYLRTDGTGVNDRAYIKVAAALTWTAIVTVA